MKVSVMIATRNRCEELRRTLRKLAELQPPADEILVCADGCTDGTTEMVQREFPHCKLIENESPRGSIVSRDRLLRIANGEIVVSLDDDSYPIDQNFFARTQLLSAEHPKVAVFAFPEIRDGGEFADPAKTPSSPAHLTAAYANCAAAMRRDVYLRSHGFPLFFGHMYEEPDYALQCYNLDCVIQFEPSFLVRHHLSATRREPIKRHHLNARNELWSVLMRCPFPYLLGVALFRVWRQFRYACSEGLTWAAREPIWWMSALRGMPNCLWHRSPIAWPIYYAWMRLARQPRLATQHLRHKRPAATCGIVIPSYNRCAELRFTCRQIQKLDPPPDEVIICLDGCNDGSREMLRNEFPEYQVVDNAVPQGSIPARDRAFRLANSDFIITLDDDSYPTDPAFILKIRQVMEDHPEAGAITFPEIRDYGLANPTLGPQSSGRYIRDFPNCAGVMRRILYGFSAQYAVFFSHAYAEPDYCLQLYTAGYAVWFEPSLTIRHHFTAKERDMLGRHHLNARNELWSVLMRCPFPYVIAVAPLRMLRQFIFAMGKGFSWWIQEPKWWGNALKGIPTCLRHRKPVRSRSYFNWMRLARNPASTIEELETRFGRPFNAQLELFR